MQTLVEGQTLLHDGRYRSFATHRQRHEVHARRSSTQSLLLVPCLSFLSLSAHFCYQRLDVQHERQVAIKCVRQQELNALGEREVVILRQINDRDAAGACAGRYSTL